jgi:hypothetical protein
VKPGNFVYLDPPYAVTSRRIFKEYGKKVFDASDISRFSDALVAIDKVRADFLVSYADCREARTLAGNWNSARFPVRRNIAGFAGARRNAYEWLITMLRDAMGLAQRGCHLLDGKDVLGIAQTTAQLGQGALIYVDDFVGSGVQLCDARDYVAANVVGTFSEFALIPTICEEGYAELAKRGVETYSGHLHSKVARPLHANSSIFDRDTKNRLIEICNTIDPVSGLGFLDGAVMVVLYRGPPDNVPIILRGNPDQTPYAGLFPRYSDLPLPTIA